MQLVTFFYQINDGQWQASDWLLGKEIITSNSVIILEK